MFIKINAKMMICTLLVFALLTTPVLASDSYVAVKTSKVLALGENWNVDEANAIVASYNEDVYIKAWLFYDNQNIYLQYDVYTDFPMANSYTGHDIWKADSIEFALATNNLVETEKWIIGMTDKDGYQIATRKPRTLIDVGQGVDVEIGATDFGYRAQVIFDLNQASMSKFVPEMSNGLMFSIMVNDSKDGVERTRVIALTENVNEPSQHVPLFFK